MCMEPATPEKQSRPGTDPVQLIIWGVLLIGYGVYSVYQTMNSGIEDNLLYLVMPNVILTVFGVLMIMVGYRNEKKAKTQIDQ